MLYFTGDGSPRFFPLVESQVSVDNSTLSGGEGETQQHLNDYLINYVINHLVILKLVIMIHALQS